MSKLTDDHSIEFTRKRSASQCFWQNFFFHFFQQTTCSWQFFVTFLGWLSDLFKWLSHLQLGDEKVTKNHLVFILLLLLLFFFFSLWPSIIVWIPSRCFLDMMIYPRIRVSPRQKEIFYANASSIFQRYTIHKFQKTISINPDWFVPLPSSSLHQFFCFYILVGNPYKPLFATITEEEGQPKIYGLYL